MALDLKQLQITSHKTAQDHGFWATEEQRNIPSKIALIHEEVSEALGEFRSGHHPAEVYFEGGKPEGFGVELGDAIIRICDLAEFLGIDLEEVILLKANYNLNREYMHGRRV